MPEAEKVALSLLLRHAARRHLGLEDGDYWPSDVADTQAAAILASTWLAEHDAEVRRQGAVAALREAADQWQLSDWANAPRRAFPLQERIANAQYVTDWLRERAERVGGGGE